MSSASTRGAAASRRLSEARAELERAAAGLDLPRIILLQKMAAAMTTSIVKNIAADSDIATHDFEVAFSNQLLIHHATTDEPLNKKSFEYLLRNAFEADGRRATINPKTGTWDVKVDGIPLSCKTQAGRGISSRIEIQKLMEAKWIRDCRTSEEHVRQAIPLLTHHLGHYKRILMLRAFRVSDEMYRYRLIEVPMELIRLLLAITPETVIRNKETKKTKDPSWGAYIPYSWDGKPVKGKGFRMLFDRSVEKVRVYSLPEGHCRFHGEWQIPVPRPKTDEDLAQEVGKAATE
jgi:hypothetical protein